MVICRLLLPFVYLGAYLFQTAQADSTEHFNKRIINGFDVAQDLVKGSVSYYRPLATGYSTMCGGTILSPKHILTAAHCMFNDDGSFSPTDNLTIGYNGINRTSQLFTKSKKITLVDSTYSSNRNKLYDMAIVEMEEIELNENTQRVPIFNGYLSEIQPLLTVGWGQTETGDIVDDIRGTIVYTGNQTLCQSSWPDFKDNNSQLVCTAALLNPHHGVCFGDSGSGSFVNQDGVLMVVGPTASMSDPKGIFCIYDEGTTWYTRASYHLDAISQITGLSKEYLTGLSNEI